MARRALALLPRCNDNNTVTKINNDQSKFLEEHFEFVCNFNQTEYNGYIRAFVEMLHPTGSEYCFNYIKKYFAAMPDRPVSNFCR